MIAVESTKTPTGTARAEDIFNDDLSRQSDNPPTGTARTEDPVEAK